MSHKETCHHWAHQTGKKRNGGRVSYDGPVLYSYRTPIARLVENKGETIALLSTMRWSSSTSTHQGYAKGSVNHLASFYVDNISPQNKLDYRKNHSGIVRSAIDCVEKSKRARTNGACHLDRAREYVDSANAYAQTFKISVNVVSFDKLESIGEAMDKIADRRIKETARVKTKLQIAERIESRKRLRAWLNGANVRPPRTFRPMVRVNGNNVETTHGAVVPLADALNVYRLAKICRNSNSGMYMMESAGDFGSGYVDNRGNIEISCHKIPFRYAKMAACLAGIDN